MAQDLKARELNLTDNERDLLVRCIADAYEALRVIPGVDGNGPALVWLADHLFEAHRRNEKTR